MLRVVVLPEPVPPEMTMFSLAWTQALRNSSTSGVTEPRSTSFWGVMGMRENLRMVSTGPMSDRGGMTALTREPSGRRAST